MSLCWKIRQCFCSHEWEFKPSRPGEEDHGLDHSKRYCKKCKLCEVARYHKHGDVRLTWHATVNVWDGYASSSEPWEDS